ncbi:MAG: hypothetical protein LBK47_05555 [Prevotellaceae bacterium]|jgi:tetratricopeptide (TPR) repeat protein|nr:hypothetical protein [Prevotellaceae bacterium]
MKKSILALAMLCCGFAVSAQDQKDNMPVCLKNVSLYTDYVKQNNLQEAIPFWKQALCCCPDSLKNQYRNSYMNLYVNGIRIMKYLIDKTSDEAQKNQYIDTLLWMYDQRMEIIPSQRKSSLWRKAADYARYRPQDVKQIYDMCVEAIGMLGDETDISTVILSMQQASQLYSANELPADVVMDLYMRLSKILENQAAAGKDVDPIKEALDNIFITSGVANCENLVKLYTPKVKEDSKNAEMLEKVVNLLSANQCIQEKLYFDAMEALFAVKPTAVEAASIALAFKQQGSYAKTEEYYKKAIELTTEDGVKSKYYVDLGNVVNHDLSKPQEARTLAKKALELDGNNALAYFLLGEVYATEKACGDSELEKRSVYWVIVDCYEKAKQIDPSLTEAANKYITAYKPHFPSKEDIFFNNLERGQSYTVACWVNERTVIRPRD